jgi:hypothetical protein
VETATARLFTSAVALTEVYVIPALERRMDEAPFDHLSVVLFKALQVVAFLLFAAFFAISQQKETGKVDSKAEFFISMTWPDNHPDDFDLFVQDPVAMWCGIAGATLGSCHWRERER